MPTDFKYSLTRVCLRTGQLTLPRAMSDLFPSEGTLRAVDTKRGTEFELTMQSPRVVAGLAEFFADNHLGVNDVVLIKPVEDGRYAFTPLARPRRPDYSQPGASSGVVDRLLEMGAPLSENEIRSLFPDLPPDLDLGALLRNDGRLEKRGGRWNAPSGAPDKPPRAPHAGRTNSPDTGPNNSPGDAREARGARRVSVTPHPRNVMFPNAGLNSASGGSHDGSLHARAREALLGFGYRVEGTSHNQLVAHAEMGRRQYSVLVLLHAEGARLEWTRVIDRRREARAGYLAVFGAERDLKRLGEPADLARVSLWPWEALARAREVSQTVPISPFDLEPFFKQGGLIGDGLERFERAVGERVGERGDFSAVLTRLAAMKAPAVFLLEDVVADVEMPRDRALKVLELLAQAPFHMVARVDDGEFCLRYGVAEGLLHLSSYALSLRDRLPSRRLERVQGTHESAPAEAEAEPGPAALASQKES